MPSSCIWTAGHSTREAAVFTALLVEAGVECVIDVRRYPSSQRYPHFNRPILAANLQASGIDYEWLEALGGRRPGVIERSMSPNRAWKVEAFRCYADYLLTPAGQAGLDRLDAAARRCRVAVMCAEAVPWRCHRRIIADHLTGREWEVVHLLETGKILDHQYGPGSKLENGIVTCPGGGAETPDLEFGD